ncbi:Zn-binding Pro-Ala-Ala-Arg (PAAR) domain-containing protein, incolved in TypeVI secretion [Pseudomonas delhiensis]|uniref:Zn-binding Pro-Ala-Ala-Arg (PAAR) domain-containing protein, incolved in TypeVI secretion n=1 Tax=Pseudomonas delhiensis TaxID=366289 RepID=A0A239NNX7_9PSED|nr:PAAR domain-containing protein [Pseudomonas delhiensis]SDL22810.1 Zn-binding Pro-Ala-Ala-Arg (PAAR) domain-containing protein, incolved in TypeVI secretion [Pseudomonas delhiensis]SNT56576.1 Zn-binding Pro-Ala-Ala-Arg (PAAR) domain-containing protein, incolved in TypeVI secretion [Pseudomonas delhiensis]
MKGVIRIGDKNTSGGTVLEGSQTMKFHGIGAARVGDKTSCPVHGPTVVMEGHPVFKDHGVPVAFHGHRCACGCALLTSLPEATAS